jgi:hypothetical protein
MKHKITVIVVVLVAVSAFYLIADRIPPCDLTISNMLETKRRIIRYARIHNKLPENLDSLPKIEGHVNSVVDGWGRPIIYRYDDGQGVVLLTSLGESGDPACKRTKPCIVKSFKPKTIDGEWVDELAGWLDQPK